MRSIRSKSKKWTRDEDCKLSDYVTRNEARRWNTVARILDIGKKGSSCRDRWENYLRPSLLHGDFTDEDELKILALHSKLGNKWSMIARHFPRRTASAIKNFWNARQNKIQAAQAAAPAGASTGATIDVSPPPIVGGNGTSFGPVKFEYFGDPQFDYVGEELLASAAALPDGDTVDVSVGGGGTSFGEAFKFEFIGEELQASAAALPAGATVDVSVGGGETSFGEAFKFEFVGEELPASAGSTPPPTGGGGGASFGYPQFDYVGEDLGNGGCFACDTFHANHCICFIFES